VKKKEPPPPKEKKRLMQKLQTNKLLRFSHFYIQRILMNNATGGILHSSSHIKQFSYSSSHIE
jgi:hypothetical protein